MTASTQSGHSATASSELNNAAASRAFRAFDASALTAWSSRQSYLGSGAFDSTSFSVSTLLILNAVVNGEWLQIQFPAGVYIVNYTVAVASVLAAPATFTLAGSFDAALWAPVDSKSSFSTYTVSTAGGFRASFVLDGVHPLAFPYYRLSIQSIGGAALAASVSELNFFGATSGIQTGPDFTCRAGYYCPTGSWAETVSPARYFVPLPAQAAATISPAGSYCNATALTAVSGICRAGYFCPEGSEFETAAFVRYFVAATGLSFQSICPAGQYCDVTALSTTTNCSAGAFCPAGAANALGAGV